MNLPNLPTLKRCDDLFKTIFSKLLTAYIVIILLSLLIIGGLLYSFLWDYAVGEKEDILFSTAEKITEMTGFLIGNKSQIVERLYRINLDSYGNSTKSIIFVIDSYGTIFATSGSDYKHLEGKVLNREQYSELIDGKNIKRIGTFDDLFDNTVLTVGVPIKYGNSIIGAVFLNTSIPEINRVRYDVFRLFMISVSAALIISMILIFFLSRRISNPLKLINKAAKTIANGQFENRVVINSKDEIGQLADAFNSMAESLQNLEDMRRSFIANVSHELRTPMTTIIGFVEGVVDGTISCDKQEQYLNIVVEEAKRLSRLVNELLDLARFEAGENKLEFIRFNINELLRLSIIKFENRITEKKLHINAWFEDEPCFVIADKDSILRVLTNLLDNAIKFSANNNSIDIKVSSNDDNVVISIKDYGVGITEEDLSLIWDRFYKADKSRGSDKTGTGLGLAIVKQIMNRHGKEIVVKSKEGEFTEFAFTLEKV